MYLPNILYAAFSNLSVTPLIHCVTDFVSRKKHNVSIDLRQKNLVRLSKKIVDLDLASFSEIVENCCCRSKKHVNYHNISLSSQNDQTG